MIFGGGEPDKVEINALEAKLNELFDKKLESLDSKASSIVREFGRAKEQFGNACDLFEQLDAQPDTEDLYNANVNAIRNQKSLYARALKKIIADLELAPEGAPNRYNRYFQILANVEACNTEMLRTNAHFRLVVHCYSNHLGNFKKSSSYMEKLMAMMKSELDRRKTELSEYNSIREQILKLDIQAKELEVLKSRNESMRKGPGQDRTSSIDREEHDFAAQLESKRSELASLRSQASSLHESVMSLVTPLDRAAKKFDYMSARKRPLHAFVSDPVSNLSSETEYGEFKKMVGELKENLDAGKIDIKNSAAVSGAAARILDSDIYAMAESFRFMSDKKLKLENDVKNLEMELNYIGTYKMNAEKATHSIEAMQKSIQDVQHSLETSKSAIEKLFLDHYGKRISILL